MADTHKMRVKIGDAEFEAEGSEEAVKAQFASFLDILKAAPARQKPADKKPVDGNGAQADALDVLTPPGTDLLARVFQNDNDLVSLRLLPRTPNAASDTLLLLLYGYVHLKNEAMVLGTHLIKAAHQSGVKLDRIDRVIAKHDDLLLKGGARKGTKYGLNNRGKEKAKELMQKMLGS